MDFWGYKPMFLFYVRFSKMNAQVGKASGKVVKNSGLIGFIWEKQIYFNYPRPEAANTEPDPCPRHS